MKSTWNPKLGEGSNNLMAAFMGKDMLASQAGDEYGTKYASQLSSMASAKKHSLEAMNLEDSRAITADQLAQDAGIPMEIIQTLRGGGKVDPRLEEIVRRTDMVHRAFKLGGGNVSQIMDATKSGGTVARGDAVSRGNLSPENAAIIETLLGGKPLYDMNAKGQTLNVATGATRADSPLALAEIAKLKTEGNQYDKDTPAFAFDAAFGKGSWPKLDPSQQAMVYQATKANWSMGQIAQFLREMAAQPSAGENLRIMSSFPDLLFSMSEKHTDPETGQINIGGLVKDINSIGESNRQAARSGVQRINPPAAAGSEPPPITAQDILGNMGSRSSGNAILGNQPIVGGPSAVTHRFNPATGRIEPVR